MKGIGWRKRSFRKYFDSEDNYTEFHKKAHRLLEAPTIAITRKLQDMIEDWLRNDLKETRAADWWRDYWCGEHGNYTNATAGYVGNNKSISIESNWKYMRRDTIGSAGSNKRVSMRVFGPSLTQYVSDNSKRHADKIIVPATGAHRFPMLPIIDTKMWVKVQKFDIMRVLLSTCTGSKNAKKSWLAELDYFHEVETERRLFTDIIKQFREEKGKIHVARSTLEGIIMPTDKLINYLKDHFSGKEPTFEEFQAEVDKEAEAFDTLFNRPDTFETEYQQYLLDDVLDLMEHFHHIKPLPIKSGEQVFLCTCCDAYQKYCCVESTALSLLYNQELEVPDIERLKQIKDREKALLANPFNTKSIKEKKRQQDKAQEKAAPKWNPHMPVFASCAPGSAADMANQGGKRPSVLPAAAVPSPSAIPAADPLQRPVDPKLLVTSKAKGPPARRQRPAKADKTAKKVSCVRVLRTFACT